MSTCIYVFALQSYVNTSDIILPQLSKRDTILLIFRPERRCETDDHRENLQTAEEHHNGADPLGKVGKYRPRHRRSYLQAQCRSHIADTTHGDGDGVGIVDTRCYHHESRDEDEQQIGCEERQQRDALRIGDVHAVDLQRQHGMGVQTLPEFIAEHLEEHG